MLIAFAMMGTVASQVTATATIIKMLGGEIGLSYEMGAFIACVVFMVYTATSGLFGVVYTDVLQFYMLILFVYILIPTVALFRVGGISNFMANLDPALATPYVDGSILGDIVTYLVFTMAGAEMWQRAFAARDRRAAKRGMFLGTAVYGVTIILVYFMGVVARQIIGDDVLAQYGSTDAGGTGPGDSNSPGGTDGTGAGGCALRHHVHGGQLFAGIGADLCARYWQDRPSADEGAYGQILLSRAFSDVLPLAHW